MTQETTKKKSLFELLNSVNVNEHTEKKNGLTYLSWAWAWAEVKKADPAAYYTIYENALGWNYHTDGRTCWVKTGVTVDGLELIEMLPVMDFKNASIPAERVTSFDVNKAIQRSLTKACARHGLGLYIYAGEDLPEDSAAPAANAGKMPDPHEMPYFPEPGKPLPEKKKITMAMLQAGNCAELVKWLKGKGCSAAAVKTMHNKYDWEPEVESLIIRAAKNA